LSTIPASRASPVCPDVHARRTRACGGRADLRAFRLMEAPDPLQAFRAGPDPAPGVMGAVIVHGFTGSPWDMRPVAEALGEVGVPSIVPLLSGHDGGGAGIASARLSEWRADVRAAVRDLHRSTGCPPIVVGLSMGGLLALDVGVDGEAEVAAVASLAAPLFLIRRARLVAALSRAFGDSLGERMMLKKGDGSDISTEQDLPGADTIPFRALDELFSLMDSVRLRVERLECPLLVIHARQDHTAPLDSATALVQAATAAPWVRLRILDDGYHVITRDVCAARVCSEVVRFALDVRA
jgi:carboxylesterase